MELRTQFFYTNISYLISETNFEVVLKVVEPLLRQPHFFNSKKENM